MNDKQVQQFAVAYLEATDSRLIEKTPEAVTVKLSPDADRQLTNRPYYWSFVDRTGAEPETLTYRWKFGSPSGDGNISYQMTDAGRVIQEDVYFGSRRLEQLFGAVKQGGRTVMLFEEPARGPHNPMSSRPYTAWLGVNFKVGFQCDMKREEMFGLGISLATGQIEERFMNKLSGRRLTPRLPANVHLLRNGLTLRKGMTQLEATMERKLRTADFAWAEEAEQRRQDELERIRDYYAPLLKRDSVPEDERRTLELRKAQREAEIDWQYRPRVTLTCINCGIFHLPGID